MVELLYFKILESSIPIKDFFILFLISPSMMVFVLSCYERRRLDYPLLHKGGDVRDPPKKPTSHPPSRT